MRASRALASLVIAVYAIGQLIAFEHGAEARHARCEHGELVELRPTALLCVSAGTLFERDARDAAGHDHCAFAAALRSAITTRASAVHVALSTHHTQEARIATATHALAPLVVAPKTSPPGTSFVQSQPGFNTHTNEVLVCVRPFLHSVRSPAAPPWSAATSVRCSIPQALA